MKSTCTHEIIVRLDDVGAVEWRSLAVINAFLGKCLPLSCQVVPGWLIPSVAQELRQLALRANGQLELAQHGWRHVNHAPPNERKYEFGLTRSHEEQAADIRAGVQSMTAYFGTLAASVFTPPHDRLDATTLNVLANQGIHVVSGGPRTFEGLTIPSNIITVPWAVDASTRSEGKRISRPVPEVLERIHAHPGPRVVVVLHAKEMEDFVWCERLLESLVRLRNNGVTFTLFSSCVYNPIVKDSSTFLLGST